VVAVTEEVAKSLHIYAAYEHSRFDRLPRTAVVLGALSGIGFFVGENIVVAAQFAGLPDISVGEAGVLGGAAASAALPVLLLAPLVVHVVTAAISALGASRSRRWYVVALSLAILLHFGYNLAVVMFVA
jgi:RsiW-degrading membrane proteinase PrsW (M82 family)